MITSSVLNSVTFKDISKTYPNKWSRLHADRKQAGFTVIPYCQVFNKNDVIYLQFESDSSTVPALDIYYPNFKQTINGTLASSYDGDVTRYFYNFEITLNSTFFDKKIYFTIEQDATTLTSEPIYCKDISAEIENGTIKRIKYTNLDRNNSDLSSYWVDWSQLDFMYFYVESVDVAVQDTEESEVLTTSQSKEVISASNYSGIQLQCAPIPDYLELKLKACSSLDYFEVNEIEYIKEGEVESSRWGNSTLFEVTLNLTEKNTIGLNVDDVGITYIDQEEVPMAIIPKRNTNLTSAGWQVTNPSGYMLHSIFIKHAASSVGDAVVNIGTSVSGSELVDDVIGNVPLADFASSWKSITQHFLNNPDAASSVYVSVTGAGAVLDMIINFEIVEE